MLSKMKWKLVAAVLCTLIIVGCSNNSSSSIKQQNDDVYVMMKGNDLYIKYPDKDAEKVASNVLEDSWMYCDGKGLLFLDNDYSLYMYENGEKTKIANDIAYEYYPYQLSDNYDTIAYLTDEYDLYALFDGKDKIKVASDVDEYRISSDGELIYYVNDDDELFTFSSDEQKDKIASDVDNYDTSGDGKKIVIYTYDNNLYYRDLEEDDKTKIINDEEIYQYLLHVDNNGDLAYISEYDSGKGELYFTSSNGESKRIASDVTYFQKQDDSFYFMDADENLYLKEVNAEKSEKLAEEIQNYYIAGNNVYYVDGDDNLFLIKNEKKEKIGVDVNLSYMYDISTMDEDIIFLTKDNELYCNKEKVSGDVEAYSAYVDKIVYSTADGALHSVSINKLDKKEDFQKTSSYDSIYYGNQLVYDSTLSAKDLSGIWEIKSDYETGFMEITESDNYGDYINLTLYVDDEEAEEEGEITDATASTITVEDELIFTKINDNLWKVADVDEPDEYYLEIARSTDQKLADYIEEMDSYYDYEYDSYYDDEEYY